MLEQFLHEQLEIAFNYGVPKPEIPDSITQNLNPTFELRDYQKDAFASFIHYFNNDLPRKENPSICYSTWQPVAVKPSSWQV